MYEEYTRREYVMRNTFIVLIIVLLGICADVQARQVYKWVDENGDTHYGDYPKENATEKLNVQSNSPAASAPNTNSRQHLEKQKQMADTMREERLKRKEEKEKAKKEQQEKERKCAIAKGKLQDYKEFGRIVTRGDKGERQYMNDAEREKLLQRTQKEVDKWCK
jgi:type IV secretory pathway VirB10-like protein